MERKESVLDKIDYQKSIDKIPADFKGRIEIIYGGTEEKPLIVENRPVAVDIVGAACVKVYNVREVRACANAKVYVSGSQSVDVTASEDAYVEAGDNAVVYATDNATVIARGNAKVTADKNVNIEAHDDSLITATASVHAKAYDSATVIAEDDANVGAYNTATVIASGFSRVFADDEAKVSARDLSDVVAEGHSQIHAFGSARVEAHNHANVTANENVHVIAFDNSNIKAKGNAQVLRELFRGRVSVSGNARIVKMPQTISEYCNFYGLHKQDKHGKFYIPVKKMGKKLHPAYTDKVDFEIGKTVELCLPARLNPIAPHVLFSTLEGAIHEFLDSGMYHTIIEVATELSAVPLFEKQYKSCKVLVLREIPKEEYGIYEKALTQR